MDVFRSVIVPPSFRGNLEALRALWPILVGNDHIQHVQSVQPTSPHFQGTSVLAGTQPTFEPACQSLEGNMCSHANSVFILRLLRVLSRTRGSPAAPLAYCPRPRSVVQVRGLAYPPPRVDLLDQVWYVRTYVRMCMREDLGLFMCGPGPLFLPRGGEGSSQQESPSRAERRRRRGRTDGRTDGRTCVSAACCFFVRRGSVRGVGRLMRVSLPVPAGVVALAVCCPACLRSSASRTCVFHDFFCFCAGLVLVRACVCPIRMHAHARMHVHACALRFRRSGKNCGKMYSDPDYFLNTWLEEEKARMEVLIEEEKKVSPVRRCCSSLLARSRSAFVALRSLAHSAFVHLI